MRKQPKIRGKIFLAHPPQHPPFRFCTQDAILRQRDVAEKVASLPKLTDFELLRMELKPTVVPQPRVNPEKDVDEIIAVGRQDNRVVGVPHVPSLSKIFFDEVIECVHVHVREELARQVADWQSDFLI